MVAICCICWFNFVIDILPSLGILTGIIGGIYGLRQYYLNSKIKRAEVLSGLVERFYFEGKFTKVREWLDTDRQKKMSWEVFKKETEKENIAAEFSDYLNYFQFIVSLRKLAQIKDSDISVMFNYYIVNLKNNTNVMKYLVEYGYKELNDFILKYHAK